jgi:hypothetical protein
MSRKRWLLMVSLTLGAGPILAAELSDFVPARDGALSCWSRIYDAAHLKSHPAQKVAEMNFAISYAAESAEYAAQYSFLIQAKLRDGTAGANTGPCSETDGEIMCGVECDGGYVMVEARSDGGVLLDLDASGYIYLEGGCGSENEDGGFALEAGADDREFLLRPVPAHQCGPALFE